MARILPDADRGLLNDVSRTETPSLFESKRDRAEAGHHVGFLSTGEEMDVPPAIRNGVRLGKPSWWRAWEYLDFNTGDSKAGIFPADANVDDHSDNDNGPGSILQAAPKSTRVFGDNSIGI